MKICPSCQDFCLYDDTCQVCPHCGSELKPYQRLNVPAETSGQSDLPGTDAVSVVATDTEPGVVVHPVEVAVAEADMPPAFAYEKEGGSLVLRGRVTEIKNVVRYPTWMKKAVHVFTSGEPFQLGKTAQQTVIRLEEFCPDTATPQKLNVIFYGGSDGYLTVGDDITVEAEYTHGRYVAKKIYSHDTESEVPKDFLIPAPAFIIMVLLPVFLLALLVGRGGYAVYTGVSGGSILLPTLLAGMGLGAAAIGRIKKTVSKVLSAFKTAAIVLLILYILLLLLR